MSFHALVLLMMLSAPAPAQEAETLLRAGRVLDAIPVAEREALAVPSNIDAWERWIDLYRSVGLLDRMMPTLRTRVLRNPEDPDAHYLLGRAVDDPEASREAYETALGLAPDHPRAWMGIGAIERATGDLKDAGAAYQRALRGDPSLGEAWGGLLAVFAALGDQAAVERLARAAIEAVPDEPDPWLALAAADRKDAGAVLRRAVGRVGWDARIVAALAEQMLREGDPTAALAAAERAIELDPRHRGARFAQLVAAEQVAGVLDREAVLTLAEARGLPGEAAAARLAPLVDAQPRSVMVRIARASARPTSESAMAEADLRAALAIDPDHPEARAALGLRRLEADPAEAAALLAPVVAARPEDPDLATALGRARLAAGQVDTARSDLVPAAERHPFHTELALTHIHARSASGDAMGALQASRALAERLPEPRTLLVWAVAAAAADRPAEAARVYRRLARSTGDPRFSTAADRLDAANATPDDAP